MVLYFTTAHTGTLPDRRMSQSWHMAAAVTAGLCTSDEQAHQGEVLLLHQRAVLPMVHVCVVYLPMVGRRRAVGMKTRTCAKTIEMA